MATCGTCHREITWATGPDGDAIALDKTPSYDGPDRYTLQYPQGGGRPNALRITARGHFAGYQLHQEVCGRGRPV